MNSYTASSPVSVCRQKAAFAAWGLNYQSRVGPDGPGSKPSRIAINVSVLTDLQSEGKVQMVEIGDAGQALGRGIDPVLLFENTYFVKPYYEQAAG